jgi:repressor LexA
MMSRKRSTQLTDKQRKVLQMLARFQEENGYPPSIREICVVAQISSTSVANYYLNQLEEMGYIERDGRVSRGIRIVKDTADKVLDTGRRTVRAVQQVAEEVLRIPVVGRIFASAPVPVPSSDFGYMDSESMVNVARSMLSAREKPEELFALEVQGDSMIDAMINEGDIVIMRPTREREVRNGDMVAIWLRDRDETTLKYFYRENGRVRLQPANPTMKPIYIDDPSIVEVQGQVVMVVRRLESPVA